VLTNTYTWQQEKNSNLKFEPKTFKMSAPVASVNSNKMDLAKPASFNDDNLILQNVLAPTQYWRNIRLEDVKDAKGNIIQSCDIDLVKVLPTAEPKEENKEIPGGKDEKSVVDVSDLFTVCKVPKAQKVGQANQVARKEGAKESKDGESDAEVKTPWTKPFYYLAIPRLQPQTSYTLIVTSFAKVNFMKMQYGDWNGYPGNSAMQYQSDMGVIGFFQFIKFHLLLSVVQAARLSLSVSSQEFVVEARIQDTNGNWHDKNALDCIRWLQKAGEKIVVLIVQKGDCIQAAEYKKRLLEAKAKNAKEMVDLMTRQLEEEKSSLTKVSFWNSFE
jgi:hypothetical protein